MPKRKEIHVDLRKKVVKSYTVKSKHITVCRIAIFCLIAKYKTHAYGMIEKESHGDILKDNMKNFCCKPDTGSQLGLPAKK